jgi:hypothetical protein
MSAIGTGASVTVGNGASWTIGLIGLTGLTGFVTFVIDFTQLLLVSTHAPIVGWLYGSEQVVVCVCVIVPV